MLGCFGNWQLNFEFSDNWSVYGQVFLEMTKKQRVEPTLLGITSHLKWVLELVSVCSGLEYKFFN